MRWDIKEVRGCYRVWTDLGRRAEHNKSLTRQVAGGRAWKRACPIAESGSSLEPGTFSPRFPD